MPTDQPAASPSHLPGKPVTVGEWAGEGMEQGGEFAQQVQQIDALKMFIRALPSWSNVHQTGVTITISSQPDSGGVSVEFGFNKKELSVVAANALIDRLVDTSRLMELETLVEHLRGLGVPAYQLDPVVEEAEKIAIKLHGDEQEG